MAKDTLTSLSAVFKDPGTSDRLQQVAPTSHAAASNFWSSVTNDANLQPRVRELVLLALHASVAALNETAIRRQVKRALVAGASEGDVLDVLISVVGLGNHALYFAIPILQEQLASELGEDAPEVPPLRSDIQVLKDDFIKTRGFWNEQRDTIARLVPDYFGALSELSMEPWKNGALSPKEREFVFIAIDCSATHMYGPGLAMHIRHALKHGATREELLAVFQLVALTGMESYVLGVDALFGEGAKRV